MLPKDELISALREHVRALRKLATESVSQEKDLRLIAGMLEEIALKVK